MKRNSIFIIIFNLIFLSNAIAQPGNDVSDDVQILSSFNAKLQASHKLRTTPNLLAVSNNSNELLTYSLPTRLLSLPYEPPVIRPLAMPKEKIEPGFNFYGKVGYGSPYSPFADLRYNGRAKDLDYGIALKHHSANNNANVASQRFSNSGITANGTYYTKSMGIGGKIGYTLDDYYLYGANAGDTITSDTLRNRFNTIFIGAELFNSELTRSDLNYKGQIDFYRMSDGYSGSDLGIIAKAGMTKSFGDNLLTVDLINDFNTYNEDTAGASNNLLSLKPSFTYKKADFQIRAGVNAGLDSSFYILPDVEASYSLSGGKFIVIAGWESDVIKNSYRSTIDVNPFIFAPLELRNSRVQKQYGGIKVALNGLNVLATIGNKSVRNLQLYVNDTTDLRYFHTRYASGNIFNIHGEATLNFIKNLEIGGTIDLNTYNLDEARAWHLPNFESNITAKYSALKDKLHIKGELYLANSIPYMDENGVENVLNGVFDLSLGADYSITKNIAVFLDLNNITAQRYVRWYRYPNFGFNILGGVKARF